jgi:hypothetical protein
VRYRLRKENGAWHVDDIDYGHDMPFSELLRLEP